MALPHDEVLSQLLHWQQVFLHRIPEAKVLRAVLSSWSPVEYLESLDGLTRLAVLSVLVLCAYVLFSSALRLGRMLFSLLLFLLQLILVFAVVLVAVQYRDPLGAMLQHLVAKL